MDNWWVFLLFAVTCAVCVLIMSKVNKKYMNYLANDGDKISIKNTKSINDILKEDGCSRSFANADYALPEKDFFEDEITELPRSEEELFSGLSDKEKLDIMEQTGILLSEDKDG